MNKLLKKIAVTTMGVSIAISIFAVPVSASCSSWTTYYTSSSYCDNSDGCGFLWLKDTKKHRAYQERYCAEGGKQVRKTRTILVKDGCCD